MKNNKTLYIVLLIVGATLTYQGYRWAFSSSVVAAETRRGTAIKAVSGTITVKAEVETQIVSTGGGFLVESFLEEGKSVTEGEVVARIDPGNLPFQLEATRLEIENLERELERGSSSSITLKTLQRELIQSEDLLKRGHISQSEYDLLLNKMETLKHQVGTEIDTLKSQIQLRKNHLEQLEDNLSRLTVKAPMSGMITKVHAYLGDLVGSGRVLADLISDKKKISAEVNQDDIQVIKVGGSASIRFFAYGNQLYQAQVRQILPNSDPQTQRFTVYLDLLEAPEAMLPGMTGEVSFYADERPNTLLIPRRALLGDHVFVIDDGVLERRKVTTGYLSFSDAEILQGLEQGDQVVAEDVDLFRDGDRVTIERVIEN